MKKGNALLSETTIISFPFYLKLTKRYLLLTIITPIITFALAFSYYLNQSTYFIKKIRFTLASSSPASSGGALAGLMGGGDGKPKSSDIIAGIQSRDFSSHIASKLLARSDFAMLSFAPLTSRKASKNETIFADCGSIEVCKKNRLIALLPQFYSIEKSRVSGSILVLQVRSLEFNTTNVLLDVIKESLVQTRMQQQHRTLETQKEKLESLIKQKEDAAKGYSITDTKILIQTKRDEIAANQKKVFSLESSLHRQKTQLEKVQSNLEQTTKVISTDRPTSTDLAILKKISNLNKDIQQLEANIQTLEINNMNQDGADREILSQLKNDLTYKRKNLKALQEQSTLNTGDDTFLDKKNSQSKDLNFQYKVVREQVRKTEKRLRDLKNIQSYRKEEIKTLQKRLERLTPLFEYIKVLKQNLIQTTLMGSAISPDVVFDKEADPSREFKRTTKLKVILFASVLSVFVLIIVLTIRYLVDPKILDEEELKKTYKELDVIGKSPDFR